MARFIVAGVTLLWGLLDAAPAAAYCRATTCDPAVQACSLDEHGCVKVGVPLRWIGNCLPIDVSPTGSPLRNIGFGEIERATTQALDDWASANCGRSQPTFAFKVASLEQPPRAGPGEIDRANIVQFRDEDWPYHNLESSLALTTLTFVATTGEIIDADIELNSHSRTFREGSGVGSYDLNVVLRHEVGHLLGLAHSDEGGSTMLPRYVPGHSDTPFLSGDDVSAVCSAYPPSGASPGCAQSADGWVPCDSFVGCRRLAAWLLAGCWGVMGLLVGLRLRTQERRWPFRIRGSGRFTRA
jgi:Matrixin